VCRPASAIPVSAAGTVLEREPATKERKRVGDRLPAPPRPSGSHDPNGCGGAHRRLPLTTVPRVESGHVGPETEHTGVRLAHQEESPVRQVWRRVVIGFAVLLFTVGVIYLDRDGYRDGDEVGLSLLDSFYYATVTLSTTGYGDITPITPGARLVNILLITPLRITFLLVLIGTTLEALTARSREEFQIRRWRSRVRQHVIVCGYGTKGRSAIRSLQALGTPLDRIVVVDTEPRAIDEANSLGLTGIVGDAGRTEVLRRASVERARAVIVAANRDDAAVLITLTVRQLNPSVPITTSVREEENANLLRQSGANTVITTSATSGRLLGLSTDAPRVVAVVEDLVTGGQGLDLHQRTVTSSEVGLDPRQLRDIVLSVTRGGRALRFDEPLIGTLQPEDILVVVRSHH
jgi:voltage-gated potassium channel